MAKNWTVTSGAHAGETLTADQLKEALNSGQLEGAELRKDGYGGKYVPETYCGRPVLALRDDEPAKGNGK